MYLIRLSVWKEKGSSFTAVAVPAFFREEDTYEELRKYLDRNFRDVAVIYAEYLDNPNLID